MSLPPYHYTKTEDLRYSFITDSYSVYEINFKYSDRFFNSSCSNCKDILEVSIFCHDERKAKDFRIGTTIFEIFNEILVNSCNGVMYRCEDNDGRACKRELQFDRWLEQFDDQEKIEKLAQVFCDDKDDCATYYVLVDKGCLNFSEIHDNFMYKCLACSGEIPVVLSCCYGCGNQYEEQNTLHDFGQFNICPDCKNGTDLLCDISDMQ